MKTTFTNHGATIPLENITAKPFQLPPPPPGMKWHREDEWKEGDLPEGFRPLTHGETIHESDEVWLWNKGPFAKTRSREWSADLYLWRHRTRRPLTFTHEGHEWTWHRPGDPMPCDGEKVVIVLYTDAETRGPRRAKVNGWGDLSFKIIGWRYAEATPSKDPYAELKAAHAEGKVIQLFDSGSWHDLPTPTWSDSVDQYRIKPDDSPQWIEWHGGECPLKDEEVEEWEYRMLDGCAVVTAALPSRFWWGASKSISTAGDIIAYRVLKHRTPPAKRDLGPEDVPPGSVGTFYNKKFTETFPLTVSTKGVWFINPSNGNTEFRDWFMFKSDCKINRSIPLTGRWNPDAWEPCEK